MIIIQEATKKLTKKLKNQRKELEFLNPVSVSASTSVCSTSSPSCRLGLDCDYPDLNCSEVDPSTSKPKPNLVKVHIVTYIVLCNIHSIMLSYYLKKQLYI